MHILSLLILWVIFRGIFRTIVRAGRKFSGEVQDGYGRNTGMNSVPRRNTRYSQAESGEKNVMRTNPNPINRINTVSDGNSDLEERLRKLNSTFVQGRKALNKGSYSGRDLEMSELTDTSQIVRAEKARMKKINDAFNRDIELQHEENRKLAAASKMIPGQ